MGSSETALSKKEDQIAETAYMLWQSAGCPPDKAEQFWFEAEAQLKRDRPGADDFGDEASAQNFSRDMSGTETEDTVQEAWLTAVDHFGETPEK